MSKNEVVNEAVANGDSDAEPGDGGRETVDIGIGIEVDIDVDTDAPDEDGDTEYVELTFDEDEVLEGEGDEELETSTRDCGLETDERDALGAADVDPDAVAEKEYSYRMLLDAGVDEDLADALRRRFSLPWSFDGDGDGDLERRSSEVRGLGAAEREWIAVSDDEEWQSFDYEASPIAAVGREEPSERPYPKPTPVTAVMGVGPDDADRLAEAGVVSAERLATINAFDLATALDLDVIHVRTWRHNARELFGE